MKKTIVSLWLCIFHLSLSAQGYPQYVPLSIEGVEPEWQHLCSDSTITGYNDFDFRTVVQFTGTNHMWHLETEWRRPIIDDGYLYSVTDTYFDGEPSGGLIEKIDLTTGERLWFSSFDLRTSAHREVILKSFLEDDLLVLATAEIYTPDNPLVAGHYLFPWSELDAGLVIRKYDMKTGELMLRTHPDTASINFLSLAVNVSNRLRLVALGDDNFSAFRLQNESGLFQVWIDTISEDGIKVNPTDTLLELFPQENYLDMRRADLNKLQISDDIIFKIDANPPGNEGERDSKFVLCGYNRHTSELLWTFELSSFDSTKIVGAEILGFSKDNLLLKTRNVRDIAGPAIMVFSTSGDLLAEFAAGNLLINRLLHIDEEGRIYLGAYGRNSEAEDSWHNVIYELDHGDVKVFDTLQIEDEVKHYVSKLIALDDEHFLMESFFGPQSETHKAWTKVRKDEILKKTSPVDDAISQSHPELSIYPNPLIDWLTVTAPHSGYLHINDVMGRELQKDLYVSGKTRIEVSHLPSGIYYLSWRSDDGTGSIPITLKFFKL